MPGRTAPSWKLRSVERDELPLLVSRECGRVEVYQLYGHPGRLKVEHPDGGHDFPAEMRKAAYRLFDDVLQ